MNVRRSQHPPWFLFWVAGLCGLGLALPFGAPVPQAAEPATLGPSRGCSCHYDKIQWWQGDAHYRAAQALLGGDARALAIAQQVGLSADAMKRGDQPCMRCHGTVVTGEEALPVTDGVSCENCHGPGGDYRRKHQPPGGYATAASLGMVPLEQLPARAGNCARCHHVTDAKLLAAGHPSGAGFKLSQRDGAIRHWEAPTPSAADLDAAYAQTVGGRPIPQNAAPPPASIPQPATAPTTPPTGVPSPALPTATLRPGRAGAVASAPAAGLALPPLEAVTDSTSTERLFSIIKQRLELLYQALGRGQ